jgi:hypothetical protein
MKDYYIKFQILPPRDFFCHKYRKKLANVPLKHNVIPPNARTHQSTTHERLLSIGLDDFPDYISLPLISFYQL